MPGQEARNGVPRWQTGVRGPKRWGVQREGGAAWGDVQVQGMAGGGEIKMGRLRPGSTG